MSYNQSLNSDSNYPLMPQSEWDNAPFNQTELEEREFNVLCSQTLSKTDIVFTSNYDEKVDEEYDDEGGKFSHHWIDTKDTIWSEEYHDNDHYTPLQLIELFKRHLEKELDSDNLSQNKVNSYKHLIEECEGWIDDETTYMRE